MEGLNFLRESYAPALASVDSSRMLRGADARTVVPF